MKPMQLSILVAIVAIAALFAGCATVTPNELINARAAYEQASNSPGAPLVPAEIHKAHDALDSAEQSFAKDSDSYKTKDLAYVAERKAELAQALGVSAVDNAAKAKADADFAAKQAQIVTKTKSDLAATQSELSAALVALAAKEEARGIVITLSGGVLFETAKWDLLPSAQTKLDQVVAALLAGPKRNIIVEGNTDSQGSESYNQGLSERRAASVRDYLVAHGLPADRIQSMGKGKDNPIADNASPEGRANNRRVEIIIQPGAHASN
jgi:outer membrane protein OmpA-like peptidoglycan-associated protein